MPDHLDGVLSPFLRRQRLEVAKPFIQGRSLDFGCGMAFVCDLVGESSYVGVDVDDDVLAAARQRYPRARFLKPERMSELGDERFDTFVALAVIEHLSDPGAFLRDAASRLTARGRLVLTTPTPSLGWAHRLGSRLGLLARASHDEHQDLLGREQLVSIARSAGLGLIHYRRFLLGANQLAVFSPVARGEPARSAGIH